ncbi:MAG: 4Fe-4S binding protein [Candidatus Cloacimonetes bacterium]|nr:4Fe-4S binding protein [Candidatus Cloacimonadota bacterium]
MRNHLSVSGYKVVAMLKYFLIMLLLLLLLNLFLVSCDKKPASITAVSPGDRITIDAQSCIACGDCYRSCPHGAIIYNGGTPLIVQTKCKQCKQCVIACPVDAIH